MAAVSAWRGEVQAARDENPCKDVAPQSRGYPSDDPSDAKSAKRPFEGLQQDRAGQAADTPTARSSVISFDVPVACDELNNVTPKDGRLDLGEGEPGAERAAAPLTDPAGETSVGAIDSRDGDRLHRAETPAKRSPRVPPRIADRSRIEEWADDELLTLPEAAALFWPAGPITTNTLRTAERDGTLTVTKVAGKFFTTPMAIRRMGVNEVGEKAGEPDRAEASPQAMFQMKLAEARRLGRDRKRTARAAKRSAVPSS